jgi:hypothetical protein
MPPNASHVRSMCRNGRTWSVGDTNRAPFDRWAHVSGILQHSWHCLLLQKRNNPDRETVTDSGVDMYRDGAVVLDENACWCTALAPALVALSRSVTWRMRDLEGFPNPAALEALPSLGSKWTSTRRLAPPFKTATLPAFTDQRGPTPTAKGAIDGRRLWMQTTLTRTMVLGVAALPCRDRRSRTSF